MAQTDNSEQGKGLTAVEALSRHFQTLENLESKKQEVPSKSLSEVKSTETGERNG